MYIYTYAARGVVSAECDSSVETPASQPAEPASKQAGRQAVPLFLYTQLVRTASHRLYGVLKYNHLQEYVRVCVCALAGCEKKTRSQPGNDNFFTETLTEMRSACGGSAAAATHGYVENLRQFVSQFTRKC